MDLNTRSKIFLAEEYFYDAIKKIMIFNPYCNYIDGLKNRLHNPEGGHCYLLTTWILIGLEHSDVRVCGEIDIVGRSGYASRENYRHAWVEFKHKDDYYVYDPLYDFITPKDIYYELHQPRNITSTKKRDDLIEPFLNEKFAFRVDDNIWQFKSEKEIGYDYNDSDGYIFNALQKGRIHGYFSDIPFTISAFIAYDPRY